MYKLVLGGRGDGEGKEKAPAMTLPPFPS